MSRTLEFDALPSLAAQYAKSALARRSPGEAPQLPRLEARARDVRVDAGKLAAYRALCGFTGRATHLPPTYPQVLATPLHAALIAHREFPFTAVGLVHVSNRIVQRAPIEAAAKLSIACEAEGVRPARSGFEFDLVTRVEANGAPAWESVTTVLARTGTKGPRGEERKAPPAPGEPGGATRSVLWRLPEDLGRRYASVSGDYNPIHLHGLTAKAFGFPRAIIHGMWTLARALGELGLDEAEGASTCEVSFRRPVLLPSTVLFHAREAGPRTELEVRTRDGAQLHLSGHVTREG
jgi:acyl dehydratase